MSKPILWVMVGLSGSGKSTIAKKIADDYSNAIIISSDNIREELTGNYEDQEHNEEVFNVFHDRIRKNLENKQNVIADATNLTIKSRRVILNKVNGLDIEKICVIIPKPFEKCKEDNLHREHPVPEDVLNKQLRRFQVPFKEEGWSEIKIHYLWKDGYEPNEILPLYMKGFDQKNPHHTMDLLEHCKYVKKLFSTKYNYPLRYKISALYHDIGKLNTQTFDENGIAHYYQHHAVGSYFCLTAMYPIGTEYVLDTCFLINYHMMPFSWESDKAKKKWKKIFGNYKYQMLLDFNKCDKAR